jgi:hypothetical protein
VIGLVGPTPPALPERAYRVLLDEAEPLAREWSVLVLTPRFGAALVAHDRMEVEATAATLEAGRLFDGGWSFRRDDALHEVVRLRGQIADRLPRAALLALDDVLGQVRELPATPGEAARRRSGCSRGVPSRPGAHSTARAGRTRRPSDRAVRLAEQEYLLVLPSLTEEQAIGMADRVRDGIAGLARSYPFVAFDVHAAVAVTARQPLPVADVRHALTWAVEQGVPLATVAPEPVPAPAGIG